MSDATATATTAPSVCVLVRSAPYGSSLPAEAYRVVQALYAFENPVTVMLMDDGVLALARGADPSGVGMRPLSRAFADLAGLKGVRLAVDGGSMEKRGLTPEDLEAPPEGAPALVVVGPRELEPMLASHKAILRF